MTNTVLQIGSIVQNQESKTNYRIISITNNEAVLCEMNIEKLNLIETKQQLLLDMITCNLLSVIPEDNTPIFDTEKLSASVKQKYILKKNIMNEVLPYYSPTYMGLMGKKPKPELKRILSKYNYPISSFWKVCTRYFQSGFKDYALVDSKVFKTNEGKIYQYSTKPGRKSDYLSNSGVILSEEVRQNFDEALNEYKSGRQKTLASAFTRMNLLHYTKTEIVDGINSIVLLPQSQRPTSGQFYYYANRHLTKEEKDIIKTSAQEHRNDKRLILSDSLNGVNGPGEMVEIDACEADVSLVSMVDPNKTIGRPIVYFMIDVFSRIILAVSVAFDNNSILGLTNLFLNLADDKKEFCHKYGMGFDNDAMWPSNIIPKNLRVDRGSEFKSKEFSRICNELGIAKQLVPGASGSLKGIVEQSFHQMHLTQNVHLENYGLIEKRYDSNHHKEATLNIEQYTKMIINFVLMHNQKFLEGYPLTKDMLDRNIKPVPALLWQYGIEKCNNPRPIPDKEQYIYTLMTPVKAKLSRRGISYKELWYYPENDPMLSRDMFKAARKYIPFECRMDMRDISNVYYLRDNKLITASLNKNLAGNADYAGLTMKEWEDVLAKKRQMKAEGKVYNEELAAFTFAVDSKIVDDAKKQTFSDIKNMRPAREIEKQQKSASNRMAERLENNTLPEVEEQPDKTQPVAETSEHEKSKPIESYSSWEEALEDFNNNF